jgi:5-methylcytosine-specific restriction endonuclease McrA
MNFSEYLERVKRNGCVSDVKILILKTLWGDGVGLSPKWISSKYLLYITKQKYFDRRARELRDQLGCDIDTQFNGTHNDHAWMLKSDSLKPIVNREYLTESQKNKLFSDAGFRCSACGLRADPGVRGLQADHKVPLSRNGGNDISNWQPLCNNCNVGKRRSCEDCKLDCGLCSWAFPEKHGVPLIIPLRKPILDDLKQYAVSENLSVADVVEEAVSEYLSGNRLKKN